MFLLQAAEDQGRSPGLSRTGFQGQGLEAPVSLAELGQTLNQRIDRPVGFQGILLAQGGQDALAELPVLAKRLGNLEILIEDAVLNATLESEEHTIIIMQIRLML
jgi:hypothetical protein